MAGLSSSERQTVEKAIHSLTKAVNHRQKGYPHHHVLHHYCQGLKLLLPLLDSPRCSGRYREILRQKCCQYISETRHLTTLMQSDHCCNDDRGTCAGNDTPEDTVTNGNVSVRNEIMGFAASGRSEDDAVKDASRPGKVGAHSSNQNSTDSDDSCSRRQGVTRDDSVKQSTQTARKKTKKTRKIYCEVATVEIDLDSEDETEAGARRLAMREVEEVNVLARQFLTEEEIQGFKKRPDDDDDDDDDMKDEESRRQAVVQKVLDAIVCTKPGRSSGDIWVKVPGVGLEELELALKERLAVPLSFPKLFRNMSRCLLLHGHPGDGILPLLRHLQKELGTYQSLTVSGQLLLQAVHSGTVSARDLIRGLFARASQSAPCALCVLDFEVFGCIGSQFEGTALKDTACALKMEMLVVMMELGRQPDVVMLVGVTSRPWLTDFALRRCFVHRRPCPEPTAEERIAVVMEAVKQVPHSLDQSDLRRIAQRTSLFSRADMWAVVDEALAVMRVRVQKARHFKAVSSTPPLSPPSSTGRDTTPNSSSPRASPSPSRDEDQRDIPREESRGRTDSLSHEADRELVGKAEQPVAEARGDYNREMEDSCGKASASHRKPQSQTRLLEAFGQETEQPGWVPTGYGEELKEENVEDTKMTRAEEDRPSPPEAAAATTAHHPNPNHFQRDGNDPHETLQTEQDRQPAPRTTHASPESGGTEEAACITTRPRQRSFPQACDGAAGATAGLDCRPETRVMYTPCQPEDPGSIPMTWLDVDPRSLLEPELTVDDVLTAIHYVGEGIDEDDVRRLRQWQSEHN